MKGASNVSTLPAGLTMNPLQDVQNNFALIDLSGVFFILNRRQIHELLNGSNYVSLNYYKEKEGKLVIRRYIEAQAYGLEDKEVALLLTNFWKNVNTHEYKSVAFDPRPQPKEVLNLWRPHAVPPKQGCYALIHEFLFEIICDDDVGKYSYLCNYLAHMLQKPEEKPMVAVILLGGQGIGKGAFYTLLKTIWRYTMRQVHSIDEVIGRFNAAALTQSFAIWMDEALFAGDKKSADRLKALITEDRIPIEEKFQPAKTIQSFHRIFGASNHEHFAPTDRDDRRFFFLKVNEAWKQDASRFDPLFAAYSDGHSVSAFVDYLLNLDISEFNPAADRPRSTEHAKQVVMSLEGLDRFLYEALQAAEIPKPLGSFGGMAEPWGDKLGIATDDLKEVIRQFDPSAERYKPMSASKLKPDLKKIFPSAEDKRLQFGGKSRRGIVLPSINQARKDFDKHVGCPIDWDPLDD